MVVPLWHVYECKCIVIQINQRQFIYSLKDKNYLQVKEIIIVGLSDIQSIYNILYLKRKRHLLLKTKHWQFIS